MGRYKRSVLLEDGGLYAGAGWDCPGDPHDRAATDAMACGTFLSVCGSPTTLRGRW